MFVLADARIEDVIHPGLPPRSRLADAVIVRQPVLLVVRVEGPRQVQLLEVRQATRPLGPGLRPGERRQKQRGEDRNYGDHNQQLDQGEGQAA